MTSIFGTNPHGHFVLKTAALDDADLNGGWAQASKGITWKGVSTYDDEQQGGHHSSLTDEHKKNESIIIPIEVKEGEEGWYGLSISSEKNSRKELAKNGLRKDEADDVFIGIYKDGVPVENDLSSSGINTTEESFKIFVPGFGVTNRSDKVDVWDKDEQKDEKAEMMVYLSEGINEVVATGRSDMFTLNTVVLSPGGTTTDADDFIDASPVVGTYTGQTVYSDNPDPDPQQDPEPPLSNDPAPITEPATAPAQPKEPSVDLDFYFLNVDTGQLVSGELGDNVSLDPAGKYSVVVIPEGDINQISKVEITVNGETRIESHLPYSAFGDSDGEFVPGDFDAGSNKITAVAYDSNGNPIGSASQEFVVEYDGTSPPIADPEPVPTPEPESDVDFYLIDIENGERLVEINTGDNINLSEYGLQNGEASIVAVVDGVESVTFNLDGPGNNDYSRTENFEEYTLFGDDFGKEYFSGNFEEGQQTLTATAYSEDNAQGQQVASETIEFNIDF
ncbi:MAG: hypothetical protein AAF228_03010 [Pseudomonadota bacterium]